MNSAHHHDKAVMDMITPPSDSEADGATDSCSVTTYAVSESELGRNRRCSASSSVRHDEVSGAAPSSSHTRGRAFPTIAVVADLEDAVDSFTLISPSSTATMSAAAAAFGHGSRGGGAGGDPVGLRLKMTVGASSHARGTPGVSSSSHFSTRQLSELSVPSTSTSTSSSSSSSTDPSLHREGAGGAGADASSSSSSSSSSAAAPGQTVGRGGEGLRQLAPLACANKGAMQQRLAYLGLRVGEVVSLSLLGDEDSSERSHGAQHQQQQGRRREDGSGPRARSGSRRRRGSTGSASSSRRSSASAATVAQMGAVSRTGQQQQRQQEEEEARAQGRRRHHQHLERQQQLQQGQGLSLFLGNAAPQERRGGALGQAAPAHLLSSPSDTAGSGMAAATAGLGELELWGGPREAEESAAAGVIGVITVTRTSATSPPLSRGVGRRGSAHAVMELGSESLRTGLPGPPVGGAGLLGAHQGGGHPPAQQRPPPIRSRNPQRQSSMGARPLGFSQGSDSLLPSLLGESSPSTPGLCDTAGTAGSADTAGEECER